MKDKCSLLVKGISLPIDCDEQEAFEEAKRKLCRSRSFRGACEGADFYVARRSIDARRKDAIQFVYTVAVDGVDWNERTADMPLPKDVTFRKEEAPLIQKGFAPLPHSPVIIGSGPAGLFAALLLAEQGYEPILFERGGDVEERVFAIDNFYRTKILDENTNIQFGAGGAGTFSDGKLVSRINDPLSDYVLKRFVEFGAPSEILWQAKPHIGTDYLKTVISNMIAKIRCLGGKIFFHSCLEDVIIHDGQLQGIVVSSEKIPCEAMVLAIGHSARDTYRMLLTKPLSLIGKPFSVGMRIEHLQSDIDEALYGSFAGHPRLNHAEYTLSSHTKTRGVYTFCMCPGGEVMAATSEREAVVVNGMSNYRRDGKNANAAVAVSVFPEDYGATPLGAMEYQHRIERAAFVAGGSCYAVPLCTVGDFLEDSYHTLPSRVMPTYMGGEYFNIANPASFFPSVIVSSLREGIRSFGKQLHGFDAPDAVLSGAETRTSSPLRILRNENREALGCKGLFPTGEGAGYAGGITSAAIDGLRSAMALMSLHAPCTML